MAKSTYRLETVLKTRKKIRDDAVAAVAKARERLAHEIELLEQRKNELELVSIRKRDAGEELQNSLRAGANAASIVSHKHYIESLNEELLAATDRLDRQKSNVQNAEVELDRKLAVLAAASKDLSAIEKHKENWTFSEKKRETKRDQKLMDEISSILHRQRDDI
ncbi:MAG: flagellar FliJ family protein [Pyrinomonadaceae bacterium]